MRHSFRRQTKKKVMLALLITLLLLILFYYIFSVRLMPVVKTMAVNNARTVATSTINNAAGKVLKDNKINYDKLITLEKDSNGKINAVKADTLEIDLLKYQITSEAVKELNAIDSSKIDIPLGTVIGGQLFSGMGPRIHVTIEPLGNVETNIVNKFTSTGINQTRQEVILDVKASITVIVSSYNINTSVDTNFDIADTIIVGDVPDSYMEITDGTNSNGEKAIIYGKNQTSSAENKTSKS